MFATVGFSIELPDLLFRCQAIARLQVEILWPFSSDRSEVL